MGTDPHQILAATLTLFQPGRTDYAHLPYTDVSTKFWKPKVRLKWHAADQKSNNLSQKLDYY